MNNASTGIVHELARVAKNHVFRADTQHHIFIERGRCAEWVAVEWQRHRPGAKRLARRQQC
jgi:hypothetical protein